MSIQIEDPVLKEDCMKTIGLIRAMLGDERECGDAGQPDMPVQEGGAA